MSKSIVGSMSVDWAGVLADFFRQVKDGSIDVEDLRGLQEHRIVPCIERQLGSWVAFYKIFFGQDLSFSGVKIPERQPGFNRLIVVAKGLTPNLAYDACAKHFPCWRYYSDLDEATKGRNEREPNEHYAILVRDCVEADEELKNLSANIVKERSLKTEDLLERELHELKFWSESSDHLDQNNTTLCSGSRVSDGGVPSAGWGGGRLRVGRCGPDSADGSLRPRSVVSS